MNCNRCLIARNEKMTYFFSLLLKVKKTLVFKTRKLLKPFEKIYQCFLRIIEEQKIAKVSANQ